MFVRASTWRVSFSLFHTQHNTEQTSQPVLRSLRTPTHFFPYHLCDLCFILLCKPRDGKEGSDMENASALAAKLGDMKSLKKVSSLCLSFSPQISSTAAAVQCCDDCTSAAVVYY